MNVQQRFVHGYEVTAATVTPLVQGAAGCVSTTSDLFWDSRSYNFQDSQPQSTILYHPFYTHLQMLRHLVGHKPPSLLGSKNNQKKKKIIPVSR